MNAFHSVCDSQFNCLLLFFKRNSIQLWNYYHFINAVNQSVDHALNSMQMRFYQIYRNSKQYTITFYSRKNTSVRL